MTHKPLGSLYYEVFLFPHSTVNPEVMAHQANSLKFLWLDFCSFPSVKTKQISRDGFWVVVTEGYFKVQIIASQLIG